MCGFAGVLSSIEIPEERLARMSGALVHRGPDAHGRWKDEHLTLLHRRLSIVDLEHGAQPMCSPGESLVVVYNGEIYNYPALRSGLEASGRRFRTDSDTEVLLHLYEVYGDDFVARLRGMFAFALWDRSKRKLLLARDHLGQKPLFYAPLSDGIAFASEIKSLMAGGLVEPQVDTDTLWHHAALRFCPGDTTLLRGVRKLRPAHTLVIRESGPSTTRRYWRPDYSTKIAVDYTEAADRLESLLDDTVRLHLMSDVPVGGFLSGGVDSSLVAAMAAKHVEGKLPTFTVAVANSKFSELEYARRAAETIGTEHHESTTDPDLMLLLPDIIWHMEQPVDAHAVGLYLLAESAARHVKVALGGDGGDETFGGYLRFTQSRVVEAYRTIPRLIRRKLLEPLVRRVPSGYGYHDLSKKARWAHEMSLVEGADARYLAMSFFGFRADEREALFTDTAVRNVSDPDTSRWISEPYREVDSDDELDRTLYVEQMTRMPEHFLHISDRMSMAHGLEMRPPLVDHRLVEFAARLPSSFKIRPGELKIILREVARRHFADDLIDRPKMGFMFPMATWFREELAGFVRNVFDDACLFEAGLFERSIVNGIIHDHQSGRGDHNLKIWNLLNLEIWYRLFIRGDSRDAVREWIDASMRGSRPASVDAPA